MLSTLLFLLPFCLRGVRSQSPDPTVNWTDIEPSPELRYQPCLDHLQCARLQLPLDWHNTKNTGTVPIAIITLPAVVPEDDPSFGGTIITNPGGPGDSGVDMIIQKGQYLQGVLDNNKHYEILSFDPRGISNSSPDTDCFAGDSVARASFQLQQRGIGALQNVNSRDGLGIIARQQAMHQVHGTICQAKEQK